MHYTLQTAWEVDPLPHYTHVTHYLLRTLRTHAARVCRLRARSRISIICYRVALAAYRSAYYLLAANSWRMPLAQRGMAPARVLISATYTHLAFLRALQH